MGFEDEAEQSLGRPCRPTNGRSKRTCELTSSIVPRGTSFHRRVELEFPPIGSDPAQLSCCCCFSNRPFEVKHFQAIHHCSVDVSHGLALLFGIGTKALPSWDSKTRRNNLWVGLAVRPTAGPSGHANSPHPSSREGHLSTAGWSSSFLLSDLILRSCHAAAAAASRVQRNSVPSTHMRCMITASRRASATIAFFMPRRLAICIAQALSQDHFLERIML